MSVTLALALGLVSSLALSGVIGLWIAGCAIGFRRWMQPCLPTKTDKVVFDITIAILTSAAVYLAACAAYDIAEDSASSVVFEIGASNL